MSNECELAKETEYLGELGSGAFGAVYKARHRTDGHLFAVKVLVDAEDHVQEVAERGEGDILLELDHEHIIFSFHSHGWGTPRVEIFMELRQGDLRSLAYSMPKQQLTDLAHNVLHHMLQALDYLASLGFVHRDVKPANIFYNTIAAAAADSQNPEQQAPYRYHFVIGDFGLCEHKNKLSTRSFAPGTLLYMAPELLATPRRHKQSHKSDVWALWVTLLWTLDVDVVRFREVIGEDSIMNAMEYAEHLMRTDWGEDVTADTVRGMGRRHPGSRWTAGQVLDRKFGGVGRVTRRE